MQVKSFCKIASYQKSHVWKLAWHWIHPAVSSTLKRNSNITQSIKGYKKKKRQNQGKLLNKLLCFNIMDQERPYKLLSALKPLYLEVPSLSCMGMTPASRIERGVASLRASAVPDPSTTIIFLIPARVTGGRNRALSLPAPAFQWLCACSKIKVNSYDITVVLFSWYTLLENDELVQFKRCVIDFRLGNIS